MRSVENDELSKPEEQACKGVDVLCARVSAVSEEKREVSEIQASERCHLLLSQELDEVHS